MKFKCTGEFGDEEIEADDVNDAAIKCAYAHAGLDCDETCQDPFSFAVDDHEFTVNVDGKSITIVNGQGLTIYDEGDC